VKIYSEKFPSF